MTRLAALLLVAVLAGCGGGSSSSSAPTGPTDASESVRVESETLVPISSEICHVRGRVHNITTTTTLDVTMRWQGFSGTDEVVGRTAVVVEDLPPGGAEDFEATGFIEDDGLVPCSEIVRFERFETTVRPS